MELESVEAVNPMDLNGDTPATKIVYNLGENNLYIETSVIPAESKLSNRQTDVPLPESKPGQAGFSDGSRPQFDDVTQTWHPYKEPLEPSSEMQAINQIGLQVAKLMADK